jgi:hypothetical protein
VSLLREYTNKSQFRTQIPCHRSVPFSRPGWDQKVKPAREAGSLPIREARSKGQYTTIAALPLTDTRSGPLHEALSPGR